jgi:antirestriction protein ArdC
LKEDKNEIFRAAADASKACDYLLERERSKADEPQPGSYTQRVNAGAQLQQARSR